MLLTDLRNRNRRWFGDRHELEPSAASAWLARRHDEDQLLCIVSEGVILGTVGWARIPVNGRVYEMGRTIGDYRATRRISRDAKQLPDAVRIAVYLVLDYLFVTSRADAVYVRIRPENGLVRKVVETFEGHFGLWPFPGPNPDLESWHLTHADWLANRDRTLARINARTNRPAYSGSTTRRGGASFKPSG